MRRLQQLYGLTPAETRPALGLLQDLTPVEYAAQQQLGPPTVRTHMRGLLTKTVTRRQAELLRRLALPLTLTPPGR